MSEVYIVRYESEGMHYADRIKASSVSEAREKVLDMYRDKKGDWYDVPCIIKGFQEVEVTE
ncbi:hypothetical protein [Jeotgalibaca porci]|uniref:hypothetical protein n=1 Tax=Jeotgalibaca porci TaxID=1868793 RepID=UPI0035A00C33